MDQAIIRLAYQFNGYGMALYVLLTTLLSGLISSFIGFERETRGQSAGLRTHVLLSVGCSLLMTISIWGIGLATGTIDLSTGSATGNLTYDTSRIAAGIVAGIGFLCGGTILKNGISIRGLTTAATLWICAAIGMACGCGFVLEAMMAGGITMMFLIGLISVEKLMDKAAPSISLVVSKDFPVIQELRRRAVDGQLVIKNVSTESFKDEKGREAIEVKVFFAIHSDLSAVNDLCDSFLNNPEVYQISVQRTPKKN
jgi:putative Mg2+ transporter-C (MgtC) family protein